MVFPLNDDFSSIHGKLIESQDFEKLDDQEALNRIGDPSLAVSSAVNDCARRQLAV